MIKLTNQLGLMGPLQTTDAERYDANDALGEIVSDLESTGLLEPIDLARVKAIIQKYTSGGLTNGLGSTTADVRDAATADGRRAAMQVRANLDNNAKVAACYRDFWNAKNAELLASVRR